MTDAAREAQRAYKRAWAKKNPDKVKAAQERFWEKKAMEALENGETERRS